MAKDNKQKGISGYTTWWPMERSMASQRKGRVFWHIKLAKKIKRERESVLHREDFQVREPYCGPKSSLFLVFEWWWTGEYQNWVKPKKFKQLPALKAHTALTLN